MSAGCCMLPTCGVYASPCPSLQDLVSRSRQHYDELFGVLTERLRPTTGLLHECVPRDDIEAVLGDSVAAAKRDVSVLSMCVC